VDTLRRKLGDYLVAFGYLVLDGEVSAGEGSLEVDY
jgi:hypothetical protein